MLPDWLAPTEYPFKSHWFQWEGNAVHYLDEGKGSAVIFLHGSDSWSFLFRDLIKDLMDVNRCIAIDLPGMGLSDKPFPGTVSMEALLQAFEAWVESLNLDRISIVAHDLGGPLAWAYAQKHPTQVERLVLLNSWMWGQSGHLRIKRYRRRYGNWFGKWLHRKMTWYPWVRFRNGLKNKSAFKVGMIPYLAPYAAEKGKEVHFELARLLWEEDAFYLSLGKQNEAISAPAVLILKGEKDPYASQGEDSLWKNIFPNAQIKTFPNCGHFIPEEAGESYHQTIREFLVPVSKSSNSTL